MIIKKAPIGHIFFIEIDFILYTKIVLMQYSFNFNKLIF